MNNSLGEQLRASAGDAIDMTIERQCRLHPELRQRFGERGLKHWREDIGHHIAYLRAAIDSGRNQPFADYLRWVAEVLERRGVELDHLHHSLDDLAEFYRGRFGGQALVRILAVLDAGRAALAEPAALAAEYRLLPPPLPEKDSYLDLLLASRRVEAQRLVSACMAAGASLATVNVRLIQIAMYDIGLLWQSNRISVAQEHLATAVSQSVMANAFAGARFAAPLGRTAVFANVEGNHHALGLRMISDAFETAGWTARFLGADVPQPSLFSLVDAERPDLLGLSVSMPQQLEMARGIIGRLRAEMGQTCPAILLGGRTINALDNIWRDLGADVWASDAEQAELQATSFAG